MNEHPNDAGDGTSYNSDHFKERFAEEYGYLPPEQTEPHYMDEW